MQDEVGLDIFPRQRRRLRALDRKRQGFGGGKRQPVALVGEGEDGLKRVIAIVTPRADVEREVDLGVAGLDDAGGESVVGQGAATSGVRPMSILAEIRAASFSSA